MKIFLVHSLVSRKRHKTRQDKPKKCMCYCIVSVEVGVIVKNEEQCAIGKNERKFSNFSKKVIPYPPRKVRRRWIDRSLTENRVLLSELLTPPVWIGAVAHLLLCGLQ